MSRRARVPLQGRPALMGALALGVAIALVIGQAIPIFGSDAGQLVRAEFRSTNELRSADPVRVEGVDVGEITDISLEPGRAVAVVTMRVGDEVAVKRDASASLRWRTVLGGSLYVDLDPGTASAPPSSEPRIPLAQTTEQVELDQVLQPLDGATGQWLQAVLRELRRGLGAPRATGRAIEALSPAMRTVARGLKPLRGRQGEDDLRRLVASTARTAAGLGREPARLERLVGDAAATLRETANRRAELGRLIDLAPPALSATAVTSRRLDQTLSRLDPLVAELRPGARALASSAAAATPTLDQLASVLGDAKPLLLELRPALGALRGASRAGRPLLSGLAPALARLDNRILPYLERVDPNTQRPTYQMIGPTFSVASSAASEFDGEGYWLRFAPLGDERTALSSPCQPFLTDPSAEEQLRCDALGQVLEQALRRGRPR